MTENDALPGGRLEYAVLVALWEGGTLSARDVHDRVGAPQGLVYTTTAKVLERLTAKGLVERDRVGRVLVFRPRVARSQVDRARATHVLGGLFADQPMAPLAALVDAVESLDPDLLDDLAQLVDARRRSRREP